MFNATVKPAVDAVLQGYNATVFAYGQTGTGKTYSMQGTDEDPGIAPRAISHLFEGLQRKMRPDLHAEDSLEEEEEEEEKKAAAEDDDMDEDEEVKEEEQVDADGEAILLRQNTPIVGIQK